MAAARPGPLYSRRLVPRVEIQEGLWVCWRCAGVEDVSPVRDVSVGGLFLSTPVSRPLGTKARVDFLVPEGQIRAEAVVQHQVPNGGLGLKFTAITDQDCPHLVALMDRISSERTSQLAGRNVATFPSRSLQGRDSAAKNS